MSQKREFVFEVKVDFDRSAVTIRLVPYFEQSYPNPEHKYLENVLKWNLGDAVKQRDWMLEKVARMQGYHDVLLDLVWDSEAHPHMREDVFDTLGRSNSSLHFSIEEHNRIILLLGTLMEKMRPKE